MPACAFLARVLRIDRASLDRVLSKTAAASLRSYSWGSYHTSFTVEESTRAHDRTHLGLHSRTPLCGKGGAGIIRRFAPRADLRFCVFFSIGRVVRDKFGRVLAAVARVDLPRLAH